MAKQGRAIRLTVDATAQASLDIYLKEANRYARKGVDEATIKKEEAALAAIISKGRGAEPGTALYDAGVRAQQELVSRNLLFAIMEAKKLAHMGIPLMDLIQEANDGLVLAAQRYDMGNFQEVTKFISYAKWWVRKKMYKLIEDTSRQIRLPGKRAQDLIRLKREMDEQYLRLGHTDIYLAATEANEAAVASGEKAPFDMDYISDLLAADSPMASLSQPMGDDPDSSALSEVVAGDLEADAGAAFAIETQYVQNIIDELPRQEAKMLEALLKYPYSTAVAYLGISEETALHQVERLQSRLSEMLGKRIEIELC